MAETLSMPKERLTAINLLASGMSRGDVAKSIGKSYKTVQRWEADQDFAAALATEIERRRQRTEEKLQAVADEQIDQDVASLRDDLAAYHKALVNVQKQRLMRGREMMDKAMRRLKDLPDEALSATEAVRIYQAGDLSIEKGLSNWGEALAVDDVLSRMSSAE